MKWNPYLSGIAASAYVGMVATFLHYLESIRHDTPDTLLDGMGFLSLLVLSVAVMAFLFFHEPLRLFLDRKAPEGVRYFLQTLAAFACCTLLVLALISAQ